MKELSHYVSFDLEFNQFEGKYHIIQVSAVRFADGPLIGYNAIKSDLPILAENGLEFTDQYAVDVFEEASKRRPSDLHGIKNLQLHTVAQFLGVAGKSHDSLEDARMTALVYEAFLESDRARQLLTEQESFSTSPFGGLDLSNFFND